MEDEEESAVYVQQITAEQAREFEKLSSDLLRACHDKKFQLSEDRS